jgi:hypothetical protein
MYNEMNEEELEWLQKKIRYKVENQERKQDAQEFIQNIIEKCNFNEGFVFYQIYSMSIANRNEWMKKISSLAYLNETQLMRMRQIRADYEVLNQNIDIFFKLIEYKSKLKKSSWYHEWLWESYLNVWKMKNIDMRKVKRKKVKPKMKKQEKELKLNGRKKKKDVETDEMKDESEEEIQFVNQVPKEEWQNIEINQKQVENENKDYKRGNEIFKEPLNDGFQHINIKLASNFYLKIKK